MQDVAALRSAIVERLAELAANSAADLGRAADAQAAAIDRYWIDREYFECPREVMDADAAATRGRDAGFAARLWHTVLLRYALATVDRRLPNLAAPLVDRVATQYARLLRFVAEDGYAGSEGPFPRRDLFRKDLALARLTMVPGVGRLFDIHAKIPHRPLLRQFPASLPAYLLAFRLGGLHGYFGIHLHAPMHGEWTSNQRQAEAFIRNLLVMELWFEVMPQIRGSLSYGWLHDPAIARVAPHLAHQNTIPALYGARFIELDIDEAMLRAAITASRSRRALYEQGKYKPRSFIRVWSRDGIRRCCEDYRRGRLDVMAY